jgi:hypothetical protein
MGLPLELHVPGFVRYGSTSQGENAVDLGQSVDHWLNYFLQTPREIKAQSSTDGEKTRVANRELWTLVAAWAHARLGNVQRSREILASLSEMPKTSVISNMIYCAYSDAIQLYFEGKPLDDTYERVVAANEQGRSTLSDTEAYAVWFFLHVAPPAPLPMDNDQGYAGMTYTVFNVSYHADYRRIRAMTDRKKAYGEFITWVKTMKNSYRLASQGVEEPPFNTKTSSGREFFLGEAYQLVLSFPFEEAKEGLDLLYTIIEYLPLGQKVFACLSHMRCLARLELPTK